MFSYESNPIAGMSAVIFIIMLVCVIPSILSFQKHKAKKDKMKKGLNNQESEVNSLH